MAKYYVYCENHGRINGYYPNPNAASKARRKHITNDPRPHGKVSVIEEYVTTSYGQEVIKLRQYKK